MSKIAVVGGGPAGMMAAGRAAQCGHQVHLYEKNNVLGKKLSITGKGRCNITNDCTPEEFLEHIPSNPNFLYSAAYQFDCRGTQEFFSKEGLPLKVERGNRVFPCSDKAKDVVQVLERYLRKNGVTVHFRCSVHKIVLQEGKLCGIQTSGGFVPYDGVILATGGKSYPGTGSTGDGYPIAESIGHTILPLAPSLVPLKTVETWPAQLMGLSLKNIEIKLYEGTRECYSDFGELLFTHFGVSGPVILSASSHLPAKKKCVLTIDLKPALSHEILDKRVVRDFGKYCNRTLKHALDELLPKKIIPVIISLSGIDPEKKVNSITKEERNKIVSCCKCLTLTIQGPSGFDEAVVTRGGVCVKEVNPSTMESKQVKNVFFAGELLDVDGYTGGFNLQIAFSTGYLAGSSIS